MCVEETVTEIYIEMDLSISASLIEEASGRPGSCERASRSAREHMRSIESRDLETRDVDLAAGSPASGGAHSLGLAGLSRLRGAPRATCARERPRRQARHARLA